MLCARRVLSDSARRAGLHVSTFERLAATATDATELTDAPATAGVRIHRLMEQYRMHPAISSFPSRTFYGGRLINAVTPAQRPCPSGFPWPDPANPVALVRVPRGVEESSDRGNKRKRTDAADEAGASLGNAAEAEVAAACVRRLLAGGMLAKHIGVVTPYRRQVQMIRKRLRGGAMSGGRSGVAGNVEAVDVATVDSFQGQEREAVILSCVRAQQQDLGEKSSGAIGQIGFLGDGRRLNVALTRARRALIVVCHPPTLRAANLGRRVGGSGKAPVSGMASAAVDGASCLVALLADAEERGLAIDASGLLEGG